MEHQEFAKAECCPPFNPEPWEDKTITWNNKLFAKDTAWAFLHMPLNFGKVITRMWKKIEESGAKMEDFLMLSYDPSLWKSEQYIAVSKEVNGLENVRLSGVYLTKVFEGPYKEARNWVEEMEEHVTSKGETIQKLYFYYTTCPKCAQKYGKNYVVAFAQIN